MDILNKIIPNAEIELTLSSSYINKLDIFEVEKGKWYLNYSDANSTKKLVLNLNNNKKFPEAVVQQLFLIELIEKYGYPQNRIKTEIQVNFGREKKRADVVVYQNDNITPFILAEIKAPHEKNSPQQLKGYLNAEGSPIGVGFNGKNISRYIRPYPKEFDTISDLPYEHEYQAAKDDANLIGKIKELIANRKWTLFELNELNKEKHFDLKAIIEELEELVLANSGVDSFDEIFKLIYAKLYDEFEAERRPKQSLFFRDYSSAKITYEQISKLFEEAKNEWSDVFELSDKIKLTPEHLEIVIGKLTEVKLYGANLRIIDEAFEYLVPAVAKGSKGQYFTPRVVIDNCVKMMNPGRKEHILDPACGSAGFLLHAMEYVWDKNNLSTYKQKSDYASKYLWGIDFEERTTKISRATMLIAGDGKTHIYKENSLEYSKWNESFKSELKKERLISGDSSKELKFDIIMSNPPFAGEIKEKAIINQYSDLLGLRYSFKMETVNIKSIITSLAEEFDVTFSDDAVEEIKEKIKEINKDEDIDLENEDDINSAISELTAIILSQISDGAIQDHILESRLRELIRYKKNNSNWEKVERHILFIERIIEILKEGGRAVIVLPQGIFNNANEKYVRRFITERARILGVVGLHGNSFKPHTGTKTSLLFIRKYAAEEIKKGVNKKNYPIFFATSKISFKDNSGNYIYAQDENGNTIFDNKGNQVYLTDLYMIADAFIEWGLKQLKKGDTTYEFLNS